MFRMTSERSSAAVRLTGAAAVEGAAVAESEKEHVETHTIESSQNEELINGV